MRAGCVSDARLAAAAVLVVGALASGTALAQAPAEKIAATGGYKAGLHYQALDKPLSRTDAADGHIEVVGFFWYGCSHCYRFEPLLQSWARKLPDDVDYQGSPVAFGHPVRTVHARAFYAVQALEMVDPLHDLLFTAMHVERKALNGEDAVARFFRRNGVDEKRFRSAWRSFGVGAQLSQAEARAMSYQVSATPQLGVNGKYLVSATAENRLSPPQMLKVVDYLIDLERRAMAKSADAAGEKAGQPKRNAEAP